MSHRPHPAPMRRQRRSPVLLSAARPLPGPALTGPWPTVTRSQGARHAAPSSLPRAAARSHRAPSPEYRPAAARSHWARLVRIAPTACRRPHRIYPTACRHPHPPMSPPSRFRAHRPPSQPSCAAAVLHVLRFAVRIAPTVRRRPRHPPISLLALRRPQGPGWQEPRRMHPFFAECAKKALFLAASARNACFSRSRWQHPRPMHPFPGAIGRFGIHGARILPPRALFRVEEPEITHGAKMLPAPRGLSAAAACGPAERALRPAARAWPAYRMRPLSSRLCPPRPAPLPSRPRSSPPSYTCRASPSEARHAVPVPTHLATCAPHPSRQPRGPTASRKQAEQRKQLNAGIKIGSPNGDPIEELFGLRSVCPTPYSPYTKRTNLRFPTWITAPDRDSGATL